MKVIRIPNEQWIAIECEPSTERSPEALDAALDSLPVETHPRWARRGRVTFCNIALWDATLLLGAEVPHWVDAAGKSCGVGKGRELNANSVVRWLDEPMPVHGWTRCDQLVAVASAAAGMPVVVGVAVAGGTGHVAMMRSTGRLWQAGWANHRDATGPQCFGALWGQVGFWRHA